MLWRKTVCLRRLGGTRRDELRAGRFFANPKVTTEQMVAGWSGLTGAARAGPPVLRSAALVTLVADREADL